MIEDVATGSLKSKLAALCMARKEVAVWHAAYEDSVAELNRSGFLQYAIKEGEPFPDFVLPSAEGRLVSLASFLERGPVIISFFRGEWCPWCQLMLTALAEAMPEIEAAGASLLALTPETGGLPLIMKRDSNAHFEVLSDVDCGVGLAAGIIFRMPRLYRARLEASGISLPERVGNSSWFLPVPATFIVTRDGLIAWRFVDADFTHRAEPADIIKTIRSLTGRV
jgi:peroxiredoxin